MKGLLKALQNASSNMISKSQYLGVSFVGVYFSLGFLDRLDFYFGLSRDNIDMILIYVKLV